MLQLSSFQERGGFVDPHPVKKSIEWTDEKGEAHSGELFVVRQPFGVVEKSLMDKDAVKDRAALAHMISLCIRFGEDASEQLTYEQAYGLNPSAAWAMVGVIDEVNAPRAVAR